MSTAITSTTSSESSVRLFAASFICSVTYEDTDETIISVPSGKTPSSTLASTVTEEMDFGPKL